MQQVQQVHQVQETKEEEARRLKMERLEREANEEVKKSQAAGPLKMDFEISYYWNDGIARYFFRLSYECRRIIIVHDCVSLNLNFSSCFHSPFTHTIVRSDLKKSLKN